VLAGLVRDLRRSGVELTEVDIGGGWAIAYDDQEAPSFEDYAQAIVSELGPVDVRIITELGRALLGPAGALVVRVLYVKSVHGRQYLVVDSGMNDLLRPALYDAYHRIVPVVERAGERTPFDVVGAVCENSDAFGRDRPLESPRPDDLLAILDAGAYGYSMASNYNLRGRPAEVVVEGDSFQVVRKAESPEELVEREFRCGG
jgi:diaminopimelate decarboxylase